MLRTMVSTTQYLVGMSLTRILWLALLVLGALLLGRQVWAEGEPGALPLLLLVVGAAGWLTQRRSRTRKGDNEP